MDEDLIKVLNLLKKLLSKYWIVELCVCFCLLVLPGIYFLWYRTHKNSQGKITGNKNKEIKKETEELDDTEEENDSNSEGPSEENTNEEIKQEPEELIDTKEEIESNYYIKLSGLPWKATENEINEFLENCDIVGKVIIVRNDQGRPSGDALVKLKGKTDLQKALKHHRKHLHDRYVDIEEIKSDTYTGLIGTKDVKNTKGAAFCKLSGLVWSATEEDVKTFLHDCMIIEVVITKNEKGKPSGDAFVHLDCKVAVQKAKAHNKMKLRERYVIVEEIEEHQFLKETQGHKISNKLGSNSEKIQKKKISATNWTNKKDQQILSGTINDETKTIKFVVKPKVLVDGDDVMEECKEIQIDGVTWGRGKKKINLDQSEIELECIVSNGVAAELIKKELEELTDYVQHVTIIGKGKLDESLGECKETFNFEIKPFDTVSDEEEVLEDCKNVELDGVFWDMGKLIKVSSSKSKIELGCTVEQHTAEEIKNILDRVKNVEDVKIL